MAALRDLAVHVTDEPVSTQAFELAARDGGRSTGQGARLLVGCACPLLTVPRVGWSDDGAAAGPARPLRRALVAWADTRESARAFRDALPLRARATQVELMPGFGQLQATADLLEQGAAEAVAEQPNLSADGRRGRAHPRWLPPRCRSLPPAGGRGGACGSSPESEFFERRNSIDRCWRPGVESPSAPGTLAHPAARCDAGSHRRRCSMQVDRSRSVQGPGRYNSPMPTRVLCLLVAVVLLWSGLSSFEPLRLEAPAAAERQASFAPGAGLPTLDDGSVEDHHLDDLPSQPQGEPTAETPGLILARLEARIPWLAMGQGPAFELSAIVGPFLAGPLRPPCAGGLSA